MIDTQASTTPSSGSLPRGSRHRLARLTTPGILLLTGLLVIQLLLALGMGWTGRDIGETATATPLMPLSPGQVLRIEISEAGQDPVALERQNEGWMLTALDGFPAADHKVEDLLTKLAGLERRLPVTTSNDALDRFRVTDDAYERKLIVTADDGATIELLFGDSPGFRRIFVRPAGETAVYEVPLAVSDISAKLDDWTDKDILKVDADEIRRVQLPDMVLTRGDDGWQLLDADQQESLDAEKVDQLIRTLNSLSFNSLRPAPGNTAGSNQGAESESAVDFQLTLAGGKELDYRLVKTVDGEHILMLSSQPNRFFVVSEYQAEQLLDADRAALLRTPEPQQEEQKSEQSGKNDSPSPLETPASAEQAASNSSRD